MKYVFMLLCILSITSCKKINTDNALVANSDSHTVDKSLFLTDSDALKITKVPCTLSNGTTADCYKIVSKSTPSDHEMGPWCPETIEDGADAGGIWLSGGQVYDVDGAFVKSMASFYDDDTWHMYDDEGNIYVTQTKEDCAAAANPNVGEEYKNFCVECLPSYVTEIEQTYLIPIKPVQVEEVADLHRAGGGPPPGGPPGGDEDEHRGPPPGGGRPGHGNSDVPSVRGLAFNGVRFDAPAPTDAILGAYTLAPFDDAGGHINLNAGYHYHAATGVSKEVKQADGHAPMIGYAIDGHGMFSQLNVDGKEPTDLDDCRGHTDKQRGYHYHVSAPGENNFINCLKGAYAVD